MHAVYSITCATCESEYVGETLRAVGVRQKEHQDAVRLGNCACSAIAEHVHGENFEAPHDIDWNSIKVLERATSQTERRVREALHSCKRKPAMNRDQGVVVSNVWKTAV